MREGLYFVLRASSFALRYVAMKEFLLKLLGVRFSEGGNVERWNVYFTNLKTPFQLLIFILAAGAAAYAIWWFYKREPDYCTAARRRLLAGLRFGGLLVLLFIISGPVLEILLRGFVKGKVVILVDSSKSMSRVDKYRRPEDKLVAAHVLGRAAMKETEGRKLDAAAESAVAAANRMELVRGILSNGDIDLLGQLQSKYDVEMWTFARAAEMKRLGADAGRLDKNVLEGVEADGVVTEIGGALRSTVNRLKGQPLSAIVVITDGGNNKGEEPALVAQDLPVRVYPVGIGVPESHDVAITNIFMESKIFVEDLAPIQVRIKQHGFAGEQAQIAVTSDVEEIARQTILLKETEEQTEVIRVKPKKAGHFTYKVEIKPLNQEAEDAEPANNMKSREVDVIDQKINVLIVEAEPRWEYRFLKNSLMRDKRVSCKVLLRVPDMADLAKSSNVFLKEFPSREDLFKYHVIIFGNMPNDGFFTEQDIENLRRFVLEEGGGIWFIAGKNNFPDQYKDSKLEPLLPVEFERNAEITGDDEQQTPLTTPYRLALTPEGRTHSVTRLDVSGDGGDEKNSEYWEHVPEIYWFHKATRAKLNAVTLLVCGDEKKSTPTQRNEVIPLLVAARSGRGQVVYQAFADLWRMRYPSELGPDALERLHGHIVQFLGLSKLLGRTARIEIATDRLEYSVGDRVKISARVLTKKDLDYSTADHITALVVDSDNESNQLSVDMTPEPGQRGSFRGEATASSIGRFRVVLKDESEENAHADFNVVIPQIEMDSPDMKKELLDNLARASVKGNLESGKKAGMYFADQAGDLARDLREAQRPIDERKENTLWDAPILLILFTLFMGAEWLLRKRSDLL